MEEATISNDNNGIRQGGLNYGNKFPSVIDTDDLVFELGKQVLDSLNKEKLLNSLVAKAKESEQVSVRLRAALDDTQTKIKSLEESNIAYQKDNKSLGDALAVARSACDEKTALCSKQEKDVSDLCNKIEKVKQVVQELDKKIIKLDSEKAELQEKNEILFVEVGNKEAELQELERQLKEADKDLKEVYGKLKEANEVIQELSTKSKRRSKKR